MGNCQAAEAATVIVQHPGGKVERLYWTTTAEEVMKNNPGHYVALVILCVDSDKEKERRQEGARVTRVKLLKPKELLLLGQVYRLITSQEVTKALQARKYDKMKKNESDLGNHEKHEQREKQRDHHGKVHAVQKKHSGSKQSNQVNKEEKDNRHRSSSGSGTSGTQQSSKGRQWRPSLNSITEAIN